MLIHFFFRVYCWMNLKKPKLFLHLLWLAPFWATSGKAPYTLMFQFHHFFNKISNISLWSVMIRCWEEVFYQDRKNHVAALWELCTNKEKMGTFSEGVDITGYISEVQKTIFSLLLLGNSSQAHNAGWASMSTIHNIHTQPHQAPEFPPVSCCKTILSHSRDCDQILEGPKQEWK